jgi:hypothetical protein
MLDNVGMTTLEPAPQSGHRAIRAEHAMSNTPAFSNQAAAAAYIAELSALLAALVRRQNIDTLGYLLDLARLEAETISHKAAHW